MGHAGVTIPGVAFPAGKGAPRVKGGYRKRKKPHPGQQPAPGDSKRGRPTGQTMIEKDPGLADRIVGAVRAIDSLPAAAESNGVKYAVVLEWIAMGEADPPRSPLFAKFAGDIRHAHADFELSLAAVARRGAQGDAALKIKPDPHLALKLLGLRREGWRANPGAWRAKQGKDAEPPPPGILKVSFVDESGVPNAPEPPRPVPPPAVQSPRPPARRAQPDPDEDAE